MDQENDNDKRKLSGSDENYSQDEDDAFFKPNNHRKLKKNLAQEAQAPAPIKSEDVVVKGEKIQGVVEAEENKAKSENEDDEDDDCDDIF